MPGAFGSWAVSLAGIDLNVLADPEQPDAEQDPGYSGTFLAQDSTLALTRRDVPITIGNRLSNGAGYQRRRDQGDDGGFAWAEDMITWQGNGAYPSGRRQSKSVTSTSLSYVVGSVIFNSDLWFLTSHNAFRVLDAADPANSLTTAPGAEAFNGATSGFRSGYIAQCCALFVDNAGVPAIYVGAVNGADTRIYEYTVSGGWAESSVFTIGVRKMETVYWTGQDGVGAERLVIQTADGKVRHCIQGSNPLLEASYVTPIDVGNGAYEITGFVAAPQHLYVIKRDGIHDVNELRAANLTPYWRQQGQVLALTAAMLWGDDIVASRGWGLDAYNTTVEGRQQRKARELGPVAYFQDGTPLNGYFTALCEHDGDLLGALYNPNNETTYIGRARRDSDGRLIWYFAEQVLPAVSGQGQQVWHMRVAAVIGNAAHPTYLWMCATNADGSSPILLYYAPLPTGGGPLSLRISTASFEVNPTARLFLTAQDWGDPLAEKAIRVYDMVGQKVSATSTIELRERVDGDPTTVTTQATWTSVGTATTDDARLVPSVEPKGKVIQHQIVLTTPSPYTAPPIFLSLSPRAKVIRETFKVLNLNVILERDYGLLSGAADIRSADTTANSLFALQDLGRQTYVDENGSSWYVYVEQGINFTRAALGTGDWRTVMQLELSIIGAA